MQSETKQTRHDEGKEKNLAVTGTARDVMLPIQYVYEEPLESSVRPTAGVKCQDTTSGTDEGCVGTTLGMTRHCDSPYGCSPGCVVSLCVSVCVCLFVSVCQEAMEQTVSIPSYCSA